MTLRDEVIQEALTWRHTPYHHLACLKGVGVDCGRLLEGIAKHLGLLDPSWTPGPYSPEHHWHRTDEAYKALLESCGCVPVAWKDRAPGVILTFRLGHVLSHSGILMPQGMILHALTDHGVVLAPMHPNWLARHDQCYDFPPRKEPVC